jgi:hypothetical protein
MAVIPRMVTCVNRTTRPLDAMFDGQPVVIPAGYKVLEETDDKGKVTKRVIGAGPNESVLTYALPYFAAEMVKRQNPMMGTEDPSNPADFESLIAIVEWKDDVDHIEQSDAVERLDRDMLDDEAQTAKPLQTAAGRRMAKLKKRGKGGRSFTDPRLKAPMGLKANYDN